MTKWFMQLRHVFEDKTDLTESDDSKVPNTDEEVTNRMRRLNLFFEKENVRNQFIQILFHNFAN